MLGELLLYSDVAQALALVVDWPRFLARFPSGQEPPMLSGLVGEPEARRAGRTLRDESLDLRDRLEAAPRNQRHEMVVAYLHDHAIKVIASDAIRSIDVRQPLAELGLSSLMAVELRNMLSDAVGRLLPASLVFDYPTIDALATYVTKEVFGWDDGRESFLARPPVRAEPIRLETSYDDLSDEELAGRLAERLATSRGRA